MLLMSQTVDEILMARDTLVFLLQGLGNKEIYPSDDEVYFTPLKKVQDFIKFCQEILHCINL